MGGFQEPVGGGAVTRPFARASIRGGHMFLEKWGAWFHRLATERAAYSEVFRRGHAIVDLSRSLPAEDDPHAPSELFAESAIGCCLSPTQTELIVDWAESLGYSRVFVDTRPYVLSGLVGFGKAFVRCPVCETEYVDEGFDYWQNVVKMGQHHQGCGICGFAGMPQRVLLAEGAAEGPGVDSDLLGLATEPGQPMVPARASSRLPFRPTVEDVCVVDIEATDEVLDPSIFEFDGDDAESGL